MTHPSDAMTATEDAVPPPNGARGATLPAITLDAEGVIRHISQPALDLLGRAAAELVDQHVSVLRLPRGTADTLLRRSQAGEAIQDEDTEFRRPDGRRCVVQLTAAASDPAASPWRVRWLLRDITAQRESEERDARLAAIVHDSDDAIISKRMDGVITSWNPAAERLFGYTAEEMIGQPISVIMPPDMEDEFPGIMRRLANGDHIDHYETIRRTKSGRLLDVSVSIAPIRNHAGRIIGASDITRDITERRALERKQREFLTMVAHDHRSPLTSIKGFAQLMQRREIYSSTGIAAILNQVRHIERMVEDVLEITRLDENRQQVTFAPVDLPTLVRAVIDRVQALQPTDRIALHAPEGELVGIWDAQRLEQVLDNVLSNAVKYAPSGPIDLTLTPRETGVEIVVQDHGQGIAPESLSHIFERFYRVPGEPSNARGVGLGLTIARTLIEAHGGSIAVASEVGAGTRVTIGLPWDSSRAAIS
jgi:PAS domain S-box-containing protein